MVEKQGFFLTPVVLPWPAFLLSEHWKLGGVERGKWEKELKECSSSPSILALFLSRISSASDWDFFRLFVVPVLSV